MKKMTHILFTLVALTVLPVFAQRWEYVERKDPITDANRSRVEVINNEGHALSFMHMEDGINVVLLWGKYFGGDRLDRVQVTYRIDSQVAVGPRNWHLMTSKRAAWMPMNEIAGFRQALSRGQTITIRIVDPLDGETITTAFPLAGFNNVVRRL